MDILLTNLCNSLDDIAATVKNTWAENRSMTEVLGWYTPSITKQDLALLAENLSRDIRENASNTILDQDLGARVGLMPQQLQFLKVNTIPQMFNGGNAPQGVQAYIATLRTFREVLLPILGGWERIDDPNLLPHRIAKRVRAMKSQLDQAAPGIEQLESQIESIREAREAAESLPTDLEALKEAKKELDEINIAASAVEGSISGLAESARDQLDDIEKSKEEAVGLVKQLNELHRIGTSTALAGAFDARAKSLNSSMYFWVFVLTVSLGAGAVISSKRLDAIKDILTGASSNGTTTSPEIIWINVLLAILSVAAPVWLAWVATKQIGQRFRLAEDYAYKASISNAYEGYRREAIRLDSEFEARLFGSALTRFDEVPLRLVEKDSHGSPLHEFFHSPVFRDAIEKSSELKDEFVAMLKRVSGKESKTNAKED